MTKFTLAASAALVLLATSASAGQWWNVNEINGVGIKTSQGKWSVSEEGGKLKGKAEMQLDNGTALTYDLDGAVADKTYTINLTNRSDSKKGCVWTGKESAEAGQKSTIIMGDVACEGSKFKIKVSF